MKKLYLIRHAKSSWSDFALDDFDRSLNKRGKNNAPLMGKLLKDKNIIPDIFLSSPALRAKTTAKIIAKKIEYTKKIIFDKEIYEASDATLHKMLTKLGNKNSIVFLVAHNPGLNILAEYYVDFYENIPTCGIIKIEFDCNKWKNISSSNAKLISFEYPKRYT